MVGSVWIFVFVWLVDLLLVLGLCQLCYPPVRVVRIFLAPVITGVYCVLSLQPWFAGRNGNILSVIVVFLSACVAFGCRRDGIRRCILYVLLRLAIVGFLQPASILRPWPLLLVSALAVVLCLIGLPESVGKFVPVELFYGSNSLSLTALRDTGNSLCDPVTGKPVLILGADAAENLTGLTATQLRNPVETIGAIPGLRLIPYRAIGGAGLLLALRLPKVRVGVRTGSAIVALSPEVLSREGKFQALTGGVI